MSRLTEKQVLEIYESPKSYIALAEAFEVSAATVSHIKTGRTWSYVTGASVSDNPKLLDDEVVRDIYLSERPGVELSEEYGIGRTTISRIRNDETYTKVTERLRQPNRIHPKQLTREDVEDIFLGGGGLTMDELADKYGVSRTTIWHIQSRKTWRGVTKELL